MADSQSRKWQITINNPSDHGLQHTAIRDTLLGMKLIYWCMSDEVGDNGTYHTHIFLCSRGGIRFSTLHKRFPGAHLEIAKGTSQENRDYITKSGKWEKHKKHETQVPDTFEEWGDIPSERPGARNDLADLYAMVKDGLNNYEILEQMPDVMFKLDKLDLVRQSLLDVQFVNTWRNMDVTYIYGATASGKTRSVMERFGYTNVYRVTDYLHPFDTYMGQDVVLFEEFDGSLPLLDMLKYLDGYPLVLPARYSNKQACFTKVFFATNIPLADQYKQLQRDSPETFHAFLRRIHHVYRYTGSKVLQYNIVFLSDGFRVLLEGEVTPFG